MSFPRYPKYKDSGVEWLGEVPEHWGVARMASFASHNDESLPEDTDPTREMLYVDISSVNAERGIIAKEPMTFRTAPSRARRLVQDGDIIISTVRTYLRAIAAVSAPEPELVVSTGFAVLRPRGAVSGYLGNWVRSQGFVGEVIAHSTGVSYPAINASDLVRLPVAVPPLEEQQAIAAFLERETARIDALVAEQERLIELLREKRQAVISHAVTQGLDPNVPMKDSGVEWLGEVPAHWSIGRIGYYATVENGSTPSKDTVAYWDGGTVPWVASGEVNQGRVREATQLITEEALVASSLRLLPVGSVLVGLVGQGRTRGMSAILEISATINQNLAAVVCGSRLVPGYLHHALGAAYEYVREYGRGGQQAALNCEVLRAVRVPVPPRAEQDAILSVILAEADQHDTLIAEAQHAIELLHERRSALISAAVTGQIDVRGLA